jgi:transposase
LRWEPPFRVGDRLFTPADLDLIRWTSERFGNLSRWELALTICENLPWKAPNGELRVHSCLPLLEGLAAAGLIELPAKQVQPARRRAGLRASPLAPVEIVASLAEVRPVRVEPVPAREQALWDATVAAHHALGFERAFGAHQRYWIYGQLGGKQQILGGLLFAAAARNVAVRDDWLGWNAQQQQRFRHRIVANSRFVVLQGVRVPHLASHVLALALRRLPGDWRERFGFEPIVVETFVAPPWRGSCYRAANWLYLGQTTGTGRQDRRYGQAGTVRQVFAYPLRHDFRQALVVDSDQEPVAREDGSRPKGGAGVTTAEQLLNEKTAERIKERFQALSPFLDEKQRRLLAGAEAKTYGVGGVEQVAHLVGMAQNTVRKGLRELQNPEAIEPERVRRSGGGRKPTTEIDPTLLSDLEALVAPDSRGDPESPLRWTCKSTANLAQALTHKGHTVSPRSVAKMLHQLGYSLQANRKLLEGTDQHPDRDAQFNRINTTAQDFQRRSQPVISVDTKKKELVGEFKNGGREWQPKGQPEAVQVHDFQTEQGKVCPYGVYDLARNEAFVSVGTDHDTATFAVTSIAAWWHSMGQAAYPDAKELLITADGGGSNNPRTRLWRTQLQHLADDTGLSLQLCHFPPGTSKWNKIEHRLFSHISMNTRGRPLISHEVVVNLIANTTTSTGLKVRCQLDTAKYPAGVVVSDEELKQVQIERSEFHPEWNYRVHPRLSPPT